ncbi:hypothetical protein VTN77DRAFT_2730 [Rasamsonia byssochlamydoides]|uniref:uncharacterized protein n=1 Tax=Rasamsonia byssochlamydoides TaxID=89139 RepID=UPI0037435643
MASGKTGLNAIRAQSLVDCDTLDEDVAKKLGPFKDCTSNQAIAFFELSKPKHEQLLADAVRAATEFVAKEHNSEYHYFEGVTMEEIAVEIAMVKLALKMVPNISGRVHVQTNPYYAYSTEKTVANAFRIFYFFKFFEPNFDVTQISIKIPSTWEGMMACRILEMAGIRTLATTLFTLTQAMLAAEVGCTYVAPYVNQLKVHFEPGFTDPNKLFSLCVSIQQYFKSINAKTQVMPASLTSTEEIFSLAGVDHITISPPLLEQLAQPGSVPTTQSLFDRDLSTVEVPSKVSYVNDPSAYRLALSKEQKGAGEEKLTQAINIFCEMQDKLEALVKSKAGL